MVASCAPASGKVLAFHPGMMAPQTPQLIWHVRDQIDQMFFFPGLLTVAAVNIPIVAHHAGHISATHQALERSTVL